MDLLGTEPSNFFTIFVSSIAPPNDADLEAIPESFTAKLSTDPDSIMGPYCVVGLGQHRASHRCAPCFFDSHRKSSSSSTCIFNIRHHPCNYRDNSCYLAIDVASNIVVKGTIMKYRVAGKNIKVTMETFLQGEALLPIPLKEEFIMKVKDAVGHTPSRPSHLVI